MAKNIWMNVKQKSRQKKYGQEAEAFTSMLLSQYKMSGYNMEDTLAKIINEGEGIRYIKKLLCVMLYRIRKSHDPDEIRQAVNHFAESIGTSWAFMLAANFYSALTKGFDISASLHDILQGLCEAKKLLEERRRANSESVRMAKFVTPGLYALFVLISTMIGVTPSEFMNRQLHTSEGLRLLFLILFLSIISQALLLISKYKKFDY